MQKNKGKTPPKTVRPSMKKDPIHPRDFNAYKIPFACEDCSHFSNFNSSCTLGFKTENHLRENALKSYELTGKMAQCRFLEID
ncbi:MAG: hypothetical protein ACK41T_06060 [Pseudobdellovibrio sp.]